MNVNDNTPKFTQALYTQEIAENLSVDSFVLQVLASDVDDETLTYSIDAVVPFKVQAGTGKCALSDVLYLIGYIIPIN